MMVSSLFFIVCLPFSLDGYSSSLVIPFCVINTLTLLFFLRDCVGHDGLLQVWETVYGHDHMIHG